MKLLGASGVVVGLMLVVGLFALARLGSDNQHLSRLASQVVPSTRAVGEINALMNKYRKDQLHYILAPAADRPLGVPGSIAGDLAEDRSLIRSYLQRYRTEGLIEDQRDRFLLDTFQSDFSRYVQATAAFVPLSDRGLTVQASKAVGDGAGDRMWDQLKSVTGSWSDHKTKNAQAAEAASHSSYDKSVTLILALLAAAVAAALALAILLAHRLTRTVREIGAAAKAIAQGDTDQRVVVTTNDEFGAMAADFDAMIEYLNSTVTVAKEIARGNLGIEVRPRSTRDALGNALATMTSSLRGLVGENERLLTASRAEANTDALTGLANRRALMRDLDVQLAEANGQREMILALFDLDGFKQYNDTYGHPAGDALLVRLSEQLRKALGTEATAYRMGGDEFCVLASADAERGAAIAQQAANALSERGEAFRIGCSYGVASMPREAATASDALSVADQRMYERKAERVSASRQSSNVLLRVLSEHSSGLHMHIGEVAQLARMTAERMGLPEHELKRIELAAELHDIGKVAIPDSILDKPGPLDSDEWEYMRRHSEIGERIVAAAPSLAHAAELVRAHHERYDGQGYPDRLAGEDIPLGARIIAVCDSFAAMTGPRPYSDPISIAEAIAELHRCTGSQFDARAVEAFCDLISAPQDISARAPSVGRPAPTGS